MTAPAAAPMKAPLQSVRRIPCQDPGGRHEGSRPRDCHRCRAWRSGSRRARPRWHARERRHARDREASSPQQIDAEEGMRAVLIRDGDYFITLGGRTRKARQLGADMFVSVHADSVRNREVSGSSVYVLSLRGASDEAARWLAESENAADLKGGVSLDGNGRRARVGAARRDAEGIGQRQRRGSRQRADARCAASAACTAPRVQHAGFVVLKSPDIPSMLVETAFISNVDRRAAAARWSHQQRIAEAIRTGIRNYWYENPRARHAAGRGGRGAARGRLDAAQPDARGTLSRRFAILATPPRGRAAPPCPSGCFLNSSCTRSRPARWSSALRP